MLHNKQSSLTWFCSVSQYALFKVPVPVYTYVCVLVPVDNMVTHHWLEWCYMLLHVHLPLKVNDMYLCLTIFPQMVWFLLSGKTTECDGNEFEDWDVITQFIVTKAKSRDYINCGFL